MADQNVPAERSTPTGRLRWQVVRGSTGRVCVEGESRRLQQEWKVEDASDIKKPVLLRYEWVDLSVVYK